VFLDGKKIAVTNVERGRADEQKRTLVLARADGITPGKHELRLVKDGPGAARYTAVAEAVRPAEKITAAGNLISVARKYVRWIPPVPERDASGKPVTPGYTI